MKNTSSLKNLLRLLTPMTKRPKNFEIYRTEPPNPKGRCWASGSVCGHGFHALVFPVHAVRSWYELGTSKISKLEIRRFSDSELVVNFDRGWDIHPGTDILQEAVEILCKRLAKEVFPRWSLRAIDRMVKQLGTFFRRTKPCS